MSVEQHQRQGERLKKIRKHLGLNQHELAEMLQITQSHLSSLEKGKYSITIDTMSLIKKIMPELSLSWLVTGMGDMCKADILSVAAQDQEEYVAVPKEDRLKRIEAFLKAHFPDYD